MQERIDLRDTGGIALQFCEITEHKKRFLELLLLADEQESMIDQYLDRGRMFVFFSQEPGADDRALAVCVVTDEGGGILELKNLAVAPEVQRKGYGQEMIACVEKLFCETFHTIQVGTGDSPLTVPFYEACGFRRFRVVENFFTDHYDHPIFEAGVQLKDMIYLKKNMCYNIRGN